MKEFEWDKSKELANILKHSVSFIEAVEAFEDPRDWALEDGRHSQTEDAIIG